MIDLVQRWFNAHAREMIDRGMVTRLTLGPADRPKRAVWVDLEAGDRLARLTVWESGEGELESAGPLGDASVVEHLQFDSPRDLDAALDRMVGRVRA
jgi:hypothetical protein